MNTATKDSLPAVFTGEYIDLIENDFREKAAIQYMKYELPQNRMEWESYKASLKEKILSKTGAIVNHDLPLNYKETGSQKVEGYSVKNILFQSRPGIYATANLYVPDGTGRFPAVIAMHGHWPNGKSNEVVQSLGHTLALNGYVCLVIDAWGSGERTTVHGVHEYHGSNLGASLMNVGETLMGAQISDNIRGVDLLSSLSYVDKNNIGATGASGGGNQTMWLSALDERVKAAMPVVSVGTFEAYIMRSNCVCELLPDGLTFTEEAAVLAMTAPRALKMANALKDSNPTFLPAEMLRTYKKAVPVFDMMGAYDKISYQLFNTGHGYWPEMRETMLGWFDLHLKQKGNGSPKKETPFRLLSEESLMVYPAGRKEPSIESIATYTRKKGIALKELNASGSMDPENKRRVLKEILKSGPKPMLQQSYPYGTAAGWQRLALESSDGNLIPVLLKAAQHPGNHYVVVTNPQGKKRIDLAVLDTYQKEGKGIVIIDLWGTGESSSVSAAGYDRSLTPFHTLGRASLWLGKTVLGQWVHDLDITVQFIKKQFPLAEISFDATRESGIAALLYGALEGNITELVLRESPVSYVFDKRETIDFFSMAVHLPGFLTWGDIALVTALTSSRVIFENPLTMSGEKLNTDTRKVYQADFEKLKKHLKQTGSVTFK